MSGSVAWVDRSSNILAATPQASRPALVAVDGVDGSGKTTFASRLAAAYEAAGRRARVVHLDDFLNPRAKRYRRGRHSPEGFYLDTYDLEGFDRWVLTPLGSNGDGRVKVRLFDHRRDAPTDDAPVAICPGSVVIVEGMFLHRPELAGRWDVSVFLSVPFAVSVARMAARDGSSADPAHPSLRRYVEGQRMYLAACRPEARATFVLDNT